MFPLGPPWTPELLPAVQTLIRDFFGNVFKHGVLEFGAGYSTVWFAKMGLHVRSFEHDKAWFDEVIRALLSEGVSADITYVESGQFASVLQADPINYEYDLVYIDSIDNQRIPIIEELFTTGRHKVLRQKGWVVVDDIHWDMLDAAYKLLPSERYNCVEVSGNHVRKTGEVKFHKTAIFMSRA